MVASCRNQFKLAYKEQKAEPGLPDDSKGRHYLVSETRGTSRSQERTGTNDFFSLFIL